MIIFGKKRYEILPADSPLLKGKTFQKTDKLKFILGEDIMQGSILKAVIPAGGIVVTRNESHTICVENFAQKSEVYIALDERLWSIEFPEGTVVSEETRQSSGGIAAPIELQDKTFTENGTYSADAGYDGLGNVTVDVGSGANIETCMVDVGTTSEYEVHFAVTVFDSGITTIYDSMVKSGPFGMPYHTFENVVKNSTIYFLSHGGTNITAHIDGEPATLVERAGGVLSIEVTGHTEIVIYNGGAGV